MATCAHWNMIACGWRMVSDIIISVKRTDDHHDHVSRSRRHGRRHSNSNEAFSVDQHIVVKSWRESNSTLFDFLSAYLSTLLMESWRESNAGVTLLPMILYLRSQPIPTAVNTTRRYILQDMTTLPENMSSADSRVFQAENHYYYERVVIRKFLECVLCVVRLSLNQGNPNALFSSFQHKVF